MLEITRLDIAHVSDRRYLPPSSELLDSDDIPVDKDWSWRLPPAKEVRNEDQNWIPNVLLMLLKNIWMDRTDWFFGVDMGVYHTTGKNVRVPVVPDGFLSLGVARRKNDKSRRSYVLWEEENIPPTLALEVVSWTPGGEYDSKKDIYAKLGVIYYIIYNSEFWRRDAHQPLEVYKLVNGKYHLQIGEPFWMPEVSLGIGRCPEIFQGSTEEVLSWFDDKGDRYLRAEERADNEAAARTAAEQSAAIEASRANLLAAKLRELGIDPDSLK